MACVHACVRACVRACVHACACVRACVHVCMYTCVHVSMCACVYVCTCARVHVNMCACVHVCMCARVSAPIRRVAYYHCISLHRLLVITYQCIRLQALAAAVRCVAFSPPGGLLTPRVARASRAFTLSVFVGDDLVVRLSLRSAQATHELLV